jgi:hypothetical protein
MNSLRRKGMTGGTFALDNIALVPSEPMPLSNHEGARGPSNVGETELPEIGIARDRLGRAERQMDFLRARVCYLERRASSSIGATARELEDLIWTRDELSASAARVAQLSSRLARSAGEEPDVYVDWDCWNE